MKDIPLKSVITGTTEVRTNSSTNVIYHLSAQGKAYVSVGKSDQTKSHPTKSSK